jgi:GxxExxY protein
MLCAGFLEKVYERAADSGAYAAWCERKTSSQVSFPVCYKGKHVGEYVADIVAEGKLIVKLTCVDRLANEQLTRHSNKRAPST